MSFQVLKVKPDVEHPETGLEERKRLAGCLSGVLADTYFLLVKTQAYHWNVVGPLFVSLHSLTEKQYENLFESVDEIAERIRAIGYPAPSSITEMVALTVLDEDVGNPTAEQMVQNLIRDHEAMVRRLRNASERAADLRDAVTADLLTERMAFHEKAIWMLRAIDSA